MHSDWENSVTMPSVLANTSTEHSQEYTLLFQTKRKSGILPDPLGTPPKSLYESHAWFPLRKAQKGKDGRTRKKQGNSKSEEEDQGTFHVEGDTHAGNSSEELRFPRT